MADQLTVPGMPSPLVPSSAALWQVDEETGVLTVSAQPHTDLFIDPSGSGEPVRNAATLLGELPPEGDFQFSARVTVAFGETFDAGVLLLWRDERCWGKLCFEFSPEAEPMIVSVICRDVADDANAFVVADRSVWLRVSRIGRVYAYHASIDGTTWQLIRVFGFDGEPSRDRIGFAGQSPTGEGCTATFDEISFRAERLADLRDGS
ncbi:DUF1349 domain-containing protein [Micromonospora sp. NPDC000316]|uniref:DUF1349 domain-containing protein n=1 Tax=Micromonospora sp. NPDC000316 TaxID=3364216 RepID=UPI0036B0918A